MTPLTNYVLYNFEGVFQTWCCNINWGVLSHVNNVLKCFFKPNLDFREIVFIYFFSNFRSNSNSSHRHYTNVFHP